MSNNSISLKLSTNLVRIHGVETHLQDVFAWQVEVLQTNRFCFQLLWVLLQVLLQVLLFAYVPLSLLCTRLQNSAKLKKKIVKIINK